MQEGLACHTTSEGLRLGLDQAVLVAALFGGLPFGTCEDLCEELQHRGGVQRSAAYIDLGDRPHFLYFHVSYLRRIVGHLFGTPLYCGIQQAFEVVLLEVFCWAAHTAIRTHQGRK